MKDFKDFYFESLGSEFIDSFGNFDSQKLYQTILRPIVNVKDNFAVMYKNRLDVLPRDAKNGDVTSGPDLAKQLLPKIKKALEPFDINCEILNLQQSPKSEKQSKPLFGSIKIFK